MARDLQVRAYAVALSQRDTVNDVAVEMHYLQTGTVARVVLGHKELDRAYKHVSASAGELARAWRGSAFPAQPNAYQCRRCEYRTICDEANEPTTDG